MKKAQKLLRAALVLLLVISFTASAFAEYSIKTRYGTISNRLQEIRKLKFKKKVPYTLKDREYLKKFLLKTFKEELPPKEVKKLELSLKTFGFVPKNFKAFDFLVNLYTEQVAGLYDIKSKQMLLVKGGTVVKNANDEIEAMRQMGIEYNDVLLIHEMQHSLQDQYFDLDGLIKNVEKLHNDDREYAVQALFEGDATLVMMQFMFGEISKLFGGDSNMVMQNMDMSQMRDNMLNSPMNSSAQEFSKAPLFFKRTMLFPYVDGMIFVDNLYKKGGWALVNKAFRSPPLSTEQVLHFQKYIMKDNPIEIRWKSLSKKFGTWTILDENVLGELGIRILFEQFMPGQNFELPAAGWGGDRYRIYVKGNDTFLVWYTTWDRKQDAREFLNYYLRLLEQKYSDVKWVKKTPGKAYLGVAEGKNCYVAINGKDVLVMEKVPGNLTRKLIKTGWLVKKQVLK